MGFGKRRVDPERVAKALGAEIVEGVKLDNGSPVSQSALRKELFRQLTSSREHSTPDEQPSAISAPNALDLLEEHHRQVAGMFELYDQLKADYQQKRDLAEWIFLALEIYAKVEEDIFYPQARQATKNNDLIDQCLVEHLTIKNLISEIRPEMRINPTRAAHLTSEQLRRVVEVSEHLYDVKMGVLREVVMRHFLQEQELFRKVAATEMDLDALGNQLSERKKTLISECDTDPFSAYLRTDDKGNQQLARDKVAKSVGGF
jgi:hypothetical protein